MPRFTCPSCGVSLSAESSTAGQNRHCPKCGAAFAIPETAPSSGTSQADPGAGRHGGPSKEDIEALRNSLPVAVTILGRRVRIELRDDGTVQVVASATVNEDEITRLCNLETSESRASATAGSRIKDFIRYFLRTPIGPRLLNSKLAYRGVASNDSENWMRDYRVSAAFIAWRGLSGARDKKGRLRESMQCIALSLRGGNDEQCRHLTKDPSGLCSHHQRPGTHTLFNFYEFFA
jgi:hypothetical protein